MVAKAGATFIQSNPGLAGSMRSTGQCCAMNDPTTLFATLTRPLIVPITGRLTDSKPLAPRYMYTASPYVLRYASEGLCTGGELHSHWSQPVMLGMMLACRS
jgi:hypothetical protein